MSMVLGDNEKPLSERELQLVSRVFSDPTAFPVGYRAWLKGLIELEPPSQVTAIEGGVDWEDVGTDAGIGVLPMYAVGGALVVANGGLRWYAPVARTISLVHCSLGTAPTGSGVTVRLKRNGVSIGTVTIAAGANVGTFVPASPAFSADDYFTVDVTAIGSTAPGRDLVVQLR